ncbi:DUF3306 domain-containing protein [Halodurantibacterium flavum]|uniref:DUF3306 domain-containing protein n=1 Tax=Halodurantibacterium flavum TaxID=1382802 RepID=A0ABW4S9D0_9RHOB
MSDNFLDRWSRRKRAASQPGPEEPPATAPEVPGEVPAAEPLTEAEQEALVASLPDIETLGVESDIRMFLQRGVPAALRNAALRRMWALDPVISTHQDVARDYAWDWNTPGGVPGHGGPLSQESVARMVDRFLGKEAVTEPEAVATGRPETGEIPPAPAAEVAETPEEPINSPAAAPEPEPKDTPPRRHGRATPA